MTPHSDRYHLASAQAKRATMTALRREGNVLKSMAGVPMLTHARAMQLLTEELANCDCCCGCTVSEYRLAVHAAFKARLEQE